MRHTVSHLLPLALRSAWNRRATLGLTLLAVALSVCLLLGVERLRQSVRDGFAQAVSGADLVVGARSSPVQLMLHAVFHVGEPTHAMSWAGAQAVARHPAVAWSIPLALGDSHRGYPVLATNGDYFRHWRHGDGQPLGFSRGRPFDGLFEAVLGAEVAEALGYGPGSRLVLRHGDGDEHEHEHEHGKGHDDHPLAHGDKPFTVVGVLARTGTPLDRAVHIGLEAMQAIHLDWQGGARMSGLHIPADFVHKFDLTPTQVSAVVLGLKSRAAVFTVQRHINGYRDEALMAVLPGVALAQLWQVLGVGEKALLAISGLVVLVSLVGLVAVVLAGLGERRRELAILRSVGARPGDILMLLTLEGLGLTLAGAALGMALLGGLGQALGPWAAAHYGLALAVGLPTGRELLLLGAVLGVGLLASLLPGWRAYRLSLADGLTPRI